MTDNIIAGICLAVGMAALAFAAFVLNRRAKATAYPDLYTKGLIPRKLADFPPLASAGTGTVSGADAGRVSRSGATAAYPVVIGNQRDALDMLRHDERVALARFLVTMTGYGPYGGSFSRLGTLLPPTTVSMRGEVRQLVQRAADVSSLDQISNNDMLGYFEQLAYTPELFDICRKYSKLIAHLIDPRYRQVSNRFALSSPDVIPPNLLPSPATSKELSSYEPLMTHARV